MGRGEKLCSAPKKKPTREPVLMLLCGLPGCGKSSFAIELERLSHGSWLRVSPDDIGLMTECKKMIEKGLKHGSNVIVDRCNASDKERKMFVREAAEFTRDVHCLFFMTPSEVCVQNVAQRKGHPTLAPEDGERVVGEFLKSFRPPERLQEGPYTVLHQLKSKEDAAALLKQYSAPPFVKALDEK